MTRVKKYWFLAGAGVVIVAAVVVLVVVLTSGTDTSTAEGTAEAAVDAFSDKDQDALVQLTCDGTPNPLDQAAPSPMISASLGDVRMDGADKATAAVSITYSESTAQTEMGLIRENGTWCVAWFGNG